MNVRTYRTGTVAGTVLRRLKIKWDIRTYNRTLLSLYVVRTSIVCEDGEKEKETTTKFNSEESSASRDHR